jgi:cobalt/nickel transport system permease protein
MSRQLLVVAGLAVAIALVVLVAPRADADPDGLERVAADQGIDAGQQEHDLASSPLAGYGVSGDDGMVGTVVAGVVGVVVVFGTGYGLFALTRRFGSR